MLTGDKEKCRIYSVVVPSFLHGWIFEDENSARFSSGSLKNMLQIVFHCCTKGYFVLNIFSHFLGGK